MARLEQDSEQPTWSSHAIADALHTKPRAVDHFLYGKGAAFDVGDADTPLRVEVFPDHEGTVYLSAGLSTHEFVGQTPPVCEPHGGGVLFEQHTPTYHLSLRLSATGDFTIMGSRHILTDELAVEATHTSPQGKES